MLHVTYYVPFIHFVCILYFRDYFARLLSYEHHPWVRAVTCLITSAYDYANARVCRLSCPSISTSNRTRTYGGRVCCAWTVTAAENHFFFDCSKKRIAAVRLYIVHYTLLLQPAISIASFAVYLCASERQVDLLTSFFLFTRPISFSTTYIQTLWHTSFCPFSTFYYYIV